jgi:hypothetical protein
MDSKTEPMITALVDDDEVIATAEVDPGYWQTDACCWSVSGMCFVVPCIAICGRMYYQRCAAFVRFEFRSTG